MTDASEIIARMRAAAKERPDYVYQPPSDPGVAPVDCMYFAGGDSSRPSCLVGFGIAPLVGDGDFEQRTLEIGEGREVKFVEVKRFRLEESDSSAVVDWLLGGTDQECTERQRRWIRRVQELQDGKRPWGNAIAIADGEIPLPKREGGIDD